MSATTSLDTHEALGGLKKAKKKRPKYIRIVECQVCGDKANDHIHYGAIACYSCRAFFRRGVGTSDQYQCTFGLNCEISVKTRKQCQYCRFQKCLAIGMKPTWVMTEEEKKEKKDKTTMRKSMPSMAAEVEEGEGSATKEIQPTQYEARMREQRIQSRLERKRKAKEAGFSQMPPLTPLIRNQRSSYSSDFDELGIDQEAPPAPMMLATEAAVLYEYMGKNDEEDNDVEVISRSNMLPTCPELVITTEERGFIRQLWQLELDTSRSVPVPPNIMSVIINAAKTGTAIPTEAAIQGYSICMQRVIKYAHQMDFFQRLPQPDRFKLLLKNVDMVVNIRTARLLRPDANLRDQLSHVMGSSGNGPKSICNSGCSSSGGNGSDKRLQVFQFFGNKWATDIKHEEKYEQLLKSIFELKMDRMTTTLLTLMALFSVDSGDSDFASSSDVKAAQEHFTVLLYRYLCAEVGRSNASFLLPQYKKTLKSLQEMADILANKRLKL